MTPEIRRAALRAAAKAAVITAIGCSGNPKHMDTAASNVSTAPAEPEIECGALLGGLQKVGKDKLGDDDPLKNRMDVYGQVFADRTARESADVQKCCSEEFDRNGGNSEFRWECCSALAGNLSACTPWGPPCPPVMPAGSGAFAVVAMP